MPDLRHGARKPETVTPTTGSDPELSQYEAPVLIALALTLPIVVLEKGQHITGTHCRIRRRRISSSSRWRRRSCCGPAGQLARRAIAGHAT
ncbi:MAG: hypothetical protein R3D69_06405 [Xanthobacteraceae bacterium]